MSAIRKVAYSRKQFVWFMVGLEDIAVNVYGFKHGIISAQIALETAYGKKVIDHNLFNIKATKSWKGGKILITTHEYIKGKKIIVKHYFRGYNTYFDSLKNYIKLLQLKRYKMAWIYRNKPLLFFKGLVAGGYATDPRYVKSLIARYKILKKIRMEGKTII